MSKSSNGPSARAHPTERGAWSMVARTDPLRHGRGDPARPAAAQDEVARAEGDYQRLRNAYIDITRREPGNEVGLAMIGADMDRAHARLQALLGLPRLPFTHEPSVVIRREVQRRADERR